MPRYTIQRYIQQCADMFQHNTENPFFRKEDQVMYIAVDRGNTRIEALIDRDFPRKYKINKHIQSEEIDMPY